MKDETKWKLHDVMARLTVPTSGGCGFSHCYGRSHSLKCKTWTMMRYEDDDDVDGIYIARLHMMTFIICFIA